MSVQEWFEKRKEAQIQRRELEARAEIEPNPDLWTKCVHCETQLLKKDIADNMMICPVCDYHYRINARPRNEYTSDENTWTAMVSKKKPTDPTEFVETESYEDRLS